MFRDVTHLKAHSPEQRSSDRERELPSFSIPRGNSYLDVVKDALEDKAAVARRTIRHTPIAERAVGLAETFAQLDTFDYRRIAAILSEVYRSQTTRNLDINYYELNVDPCGNAVRVDLVHNPGVTLRYGIQCERAKYALVTDGSPQYQDVAVMSVYGDKALELIDEIYNLCHERPSHFTICQNTGLPIPQKLPDARFASDVSKLLRLSFGGGINIVNPDNSPSVPFGFPRGSKISITAGDYALTVSEGGVVMFPAASPHMPRTGMRELVDGAPLTCGSDMRLGPSLFNDTLPIGTATHSPDCRVTPEASRTLDLEIHPLNDLIVIESRLSLTPIVAVATRPDGTRMGVRYDPVIQKGPRGHLSFGVATPFA